MGLCFGFLGTIILALWGVPPISYNKNGTISMKPLDAPRDADGTNYRRWIARGNLRLEPNVSAVVTTAESHGVAHDAIHVWGMSGHGGSTCPDMEMADVLAWLDLRGVERPRFVSFVCLPGVGRDPGHRPSFTLQL